jgi:protein involved in ribonucleotide reduction
VTCLGIVKSGSRVYGHEYRVLSPKSGV